MKPPLSIFGGTGFILSRYAQLYPDSIVEPRNARWHTGWPTIKHDVLYGIGTTSNYPARDGNLHVDIDTNLKHLIDVLPNVNGVFNSLSSWFVYAGGRPTNCVSGAEEGESGRPRGFYSATKLAGEMLTESYCLTKSVPYRILRLCNVIGNDPRASGTKNALEMMLGKVVRGEDVDVYTGDGYRNVLHVDDVCRAIHLIVTKGDLNTVYNVGAPESVRMYDLIQHAMARTGSKSRINLIAPPRFHQIVQVDSFWMNTDKLRGLGFTPSMTAYEAVDRVLGGMSS